MGLPIEQRKQARTPIKGVDDLLRAHAAAFILDDEELQLARKELKGILKDPRSIITIARDEEIQGYCVITPLAEYREEKLVSAFSIYPLDKTAYVRYIGCLPEFRGRGISKLLLREGFAEAKGRGYKFMAGHFRHGPSLHVALHTFGDGVEVNETLRYGLNNDLFDYLVGRL